MAFQFSHEFHRNWLAAPKTERNRITNDLKAIVDLLKPETQLTSWLKKHGIYEKNTTAAEQVGLFDQPEVPQSIANRDNTSSADTMPTNDLAQTDTLPTSEFLKQVTQGLASNIAQHVESHPHDTPATQLASLEADIDNYLTAVTSQLKNDMLSLLTHELQKRLKS